MDSYKQFKAEAEKTVGVLFENVTSLTKQITNGEKRMADEQNRIERLESHREKLTTDAAESLAGDDPRQYEKYQTALKNNNDEIERRSPAVKQLKDKVLPGLQDKLLDAKIVLTTKLNQFAMTNRTEAEVKEHLAAIGEHFTACDSINQDYLDVLTRIYADYGIEFHADNLLFHPKPSPWPNDLIEQLRIKLKLGGTSPEIQRDIEAAKEQERTEASNKEQMATVQPQQPAPVSHPVVEQP